MPSFIRRNAQMPPPISAAIAAQKDMGNMKSVSDMNNFFSVAFFAVEASENQRFNPASKFRKVFRQFFQGKLF